MKLSPEEQARLDEGKAHFLRLWCDVFNPLIASLALGGNSSATDLLIFSERKELQTPVPTEMTIVDFWDAMRLLEELIEPNPGVSVE